MNAELIQMIHIILYRLKKSIQNANEEYFAFRAGNETRSPSEILGHLVEVGNYAIRLLEIAKFTNSENSALEKIETNFEAIKLHHSCNTIAEDTAKKLINGPLSDTLTHIGQLAFLRRLGGQPLEWENYTNANI